MKSLPFYIMVKVLKFHSPSLKKTNLRMFKVIIMSMHKLWATRNNSFWYTTSVKYFILSMIYVILCSYRYVISGVPIELTATVFFTQWFYFKRAISATSFVRFEIYFSTLGMWYYYAKYKSCISNFI